MALASTGVIAIEWDPKVAAGRISFPRGSSTCLLPLQGGLQDQQVGVTQAPVKLLPLCWDLERVRFCKCLLRAKSLFPTALLLPQDKPTCFQSLAFWGSFSTSGVPGWGAWCGTQTPRSQGGPLCLWFYLPLWVADPTNHISTPATHLVAPLYLFC